MNNRALIAGIGFLVFFQGCTSSKKAGDRRVSAGIEKTIACDSKIIGDIPPLEWWVEDKNALKGIKDQELPDVYQVYSIREDRLQRFFSGAERVRVTSIPLPEPAGCQVFELRESGTISPELKKQHPELNSWKGTSVSDKKAVARVDFSGSRLNARISWDGNTYLVKPVETPGNTFYIVYEIKSSPDRKQSFERPANRLPVK